MIPRPTMAIRRALARANRRSPGSICPTCHGSGMLEPPVRAPDDVTERRRAAHKLRRAGYSLREIADALGYASNNSVRWLLRRDR